MSAPNAAARSLKKVSCGLSIGRRQFVALAGGAVLCQIGRADTLPPAIPRDGIGFSVWRNGSEIGTHSVSFQRDNDWLSVRSEANFSIRFGPITVYRYHYQALEIWRGEHLILVRAQTDDNGNIEHVDASRSGDSLIVSGSKSGRYTAPASAIAATHWNQAELDQPMINPQNGELMRFDRREVGLERLNSGIEARHVALTGYASLDLWYDEAKRWSALRAIATDGSIIDYHLR